ncbi:hypothetical protein TWF481_002090 [Arthrobotrys musiformis]|uniref:Uncharacterized protein n=1 Tax=Arthrobotrys musiformis TaxID=47236 RepID=A0AAV9VS72_9PEZI
MRLPQSTITLFIAPAFSFYLVVLSKLRAPWSRSISTTFLPTLQNYPTSGSNICNEVPASYALPDDYIEALAIYNLPYAPDNVRALAFFTNPGCDDEGKLFPGPGERGKASPDFVIQVTTDNPVGIHIIPLAQKGMRVSPKSFRSLAAFRSTTTSLTLTNSQRRQGNSRRNPVQPEQTTVISTGNVPSPFSQPGGGPQLWKIDTWFTETPWFLPDVTTTSVYRYVRDWVEMALVRQTGIQPPDVWGLYNEFGHSISLAVREVLSANAAKVGRSLKTLYANPVPAKNVIKPPNFWEEVERVREQDRLAAANLPPEEPGNAMNAEAQIPEEEPEEIDIDGLSITDMERADQEAALYSQIEGGMPSFDRIPEEVDHYPLYPVPQNIYLPLQEDDPGPQEAPTYAFTDDDVRSFMRQMDRQIAEEERRVEEEQRPPPLPFWRTSSVPAESSSSESENENFPELDQQYSERSENSRSPSPSEIIQDFDLFNPDSVVVGGRIPPEIDRIIQNTGLGFDPLDLETFEFEQMDALRAEWDEARREALREIADTDISTEAVRSSVAANGALTDVFEAGGNLPPQRGWQPNASGASIIEEEDEEEVQSEVEQEIPSMPVENRIVLPISVSQVMNEIPNAGALLLNGLPFRPNFMFRNGPPPPEDSETLNQGVRANEALLQSLPSRSRVPRAQDDERQDLTVANAGPEEHDGMQQIDSSEGFRPRSGQESEEDVTTASQVQKKRKTE